MKDNPLWHACEPNRASLRSQISPTQSLLVVDDDGDIRRLSAEALARDGYVVDLAEDGAAAWEALNDKSYDLMITDNTMPRLSGIELLKRMRSARMGLPVIMATGQSPEHEFTVAPWLRPDAVLLKPYTTEQLVGTVKNVLRGVADPTADSLVLRDLNAKHLAPRAVTAIAPRPAPFRERILVVDEDCELRERYAGALDRLGFYVDVAHDGEAGWTALQAENYKLLITENQMPNLTGVELVRKVRAAHMALPVVMAASRLPTREQIAGNPSLFLAATLLKPFAVEALLNTVKNALGATGSSNESIKPSHWPSQPAASDLQL